MYIAFLFGTLYTKQRKSVMLPAHKITPLFSGVWLLSGGACIRKSGADFACSALGTSLLAYYLIEEPSNRFAKSRNLSALKQYYQVLVSNLIEK